jgi:N-acetylmuramoyl-L-alanine amidase/putative methionine-R-sulfoxide reductase with GAF domain
MVTTAIKAALEAGIGLGGSSAPSLPLEDRAFARRSRGERPSGGDALQALLAFSALHQQVRQRRALAARSAGFDKVGPAPQFTRNELQPNDFEPSELFVLDEVLQLVAERAIAITGADGLGIALAENSEIVLRASAGEIKPDVGARIERDSSFSGACFRTARIIRCDDTETDDRVNRSACRQLSARSMVAVPLCGRRRVIGLLEAFSAEPFGFNDRDIDSLELLAELVVGALKPEDEDRFAESARAAEVELAAPPAALVSAPAAEQLPSKTIATPASAVRDQTEEAFPAKAPSIAEPDSLQAWDARAGAEHDAAEAIAQTVAKERSSNHPGVILVLVLVVVASLLAAGLWWKLKNAQLGGIMVQPTQKVASPTGARAKRQAEPTTPSAADSSSLSSSIPSVEGPTDSRSTPGATADAGIPTETTKESVTTQELSHMPHVTGIRHWSSADSSTVVLDLEDQVQYEAHRLTAPDRIYFDLHDTAVAPEIAGKTIDIGDPLLARVRVAQPVSGLTRVVLETKGNSNYSVSLEPNPYRLVVQVRKLGVDNKSQVNLFPGAEQAERDKRANVVPPITVPPPTKEDLQLRARVAKMRIVVDAGHGGWDLGTVGRRGLLEKDLVLEIAQRLGKLLQSRLGADVILTRNDDNYIPLDERAAMANQSQADLFVSVHANYSDLPSARGVETYYTNFFSAPNSKDIEMPQSSANSKNAASVALSAGDLHDRIEQSRRLAASVQRSLYGTLSVQNPGLRDRGVKEASYVVLTETAMPGILAEVSFVSSPTDEQKLRSDGYREQIAEALYKGIARYAAGSRGVKVASAAK